MEGKSMRTVLFVSAVLVAIPAFAQDTPKPPAEFLLKVTSQDEAAVRAICDYARQSQGINLETAQQVSGYCVGLLGRIKSAQPHEEPKK